MYHPSKSLLRSKTFWIAVAQFALGLIALVTTYFGAYVPASIIGGLAMAKAVIDIFLRIGTTQPIALPDRDV